MRGVLKAWLFCGLLLAASLAQGQTAMRGWAPETVPGCRMCLRTDNTQALWVEHNGTNVLTHPSNGSLVGEVRDLSTWAHRATTSSGREPTLGSGNSSVNSYATFDGTNDNWTVENSTYAFDFLYTGTPQFTILMKVRCGTSTDGSNRTLLDSSNNTAGAGVYLLRKSTNVLEFFIRKSGPATVMSKTTTSQLTNSDGAVLVSVRFDGALGKIQIGDEAAETFTLTATGDTSPAASTANLVIGSLTGPSTYWSGDIAWVALYDRAISDFDLAQAKLFNPARTSTLSCKALTRADVLRPDEITQLSVWWDANNPGTCWQDTTRSTRVTATTNPVALIDDVRGRILNRYASTSTSGDRPLWTTGGLNSKAYLLYDGTDDNLDFGTPWCRGGDYTIVWVGDNDDSVAGSHFFQGNQYIVWTGLNYDGTPTGGTGTGGDSRFVYHAQNDNSSGGTGPARFGKESGSGETFDGNVPHIGVARRDGSTVTLRIDGVEGNNVSNPVTWLDTQATGRLDRMGDYYTGLTAFQLHGKVYLVLMYTGYVPDNVLKRLERWIADSANYNFTLP